MRSEDGVPARKFRRIAWEYWIATRSSCPFPSIQAEENASSFEMMAVYNNAYA
jgi:hypothetical protein